MSRSSVPCIFRFHESEVVLVLLHMLLALASLNSRRSALCSGNAHYALSRRGKAVTY